jgi:hypothetical protein
MEYPTSNMTVIPGYNLCVDDFGDCNACASGNHGSPHPDKADRCLCCGWPFDYTEGKFIPYGTPQ